MIEITDQVPLTTYSKYRHVMESLHVGQSFVVPADDKQSARVCAWKYFHRRDSITGIPITSKVFTIKVDPQDESQYRCWRAE